MAGVVVRDTVFWKRRVFEIVERDQVQEGVTVIVPHEQAKRYLERLMDQYGQRERYYFVEVAKR